MNKKEIIIIIVIGLLAILLSFFIVYSLKSKTEQPDTPVKKTEKKKTQNTDGDLVVGDYSLKFGTYKGMEEEYDPDTEKVKKTEVILEINKDELIYNGEASSYEIKGNYIYAGQIMYEVTDNNVLVLQAGAGIKFKYYK